MKTSNAVGGWGRALAVMTLLWGLTAAAQVSPPMLVMTTVPVSGVASDRVIASVLDVGVSQGGTLTVTLRILAANGAVLAEITGPVTEGVPLRLSANAPSSAGVRAQLLVPPNTEALAAGVLVLERLPGGTRPVEPPPLCRIPLIYTIDPRGGTSEPTTSLSCSYLYIRS
ncbi:hypothetical protein [Corallococcus llansteffanensis]|uniref:Uncharacterized protein n=1 Tax=Corallococcus llansteffanensis TaxID=2316731 RepID=A0A3A8QKN3_9BACT|nr:hypothetical protein [Corallococcus llansteffanensis]RKH67490.1 hypothetical protein D7V93_02895 [Corallococcus llansteffanensis]